MISYPVTGLLATSPAAWPSSGRHVVIPFGRILRVFTVSDPNPSCIATLQGHLAAVVAVVPTGNMRVASASEDGTIRVWDISDGSCLRTIDVGQKIVAMCQAGPNKVICTGSRCIQTVYLLKQEKSKIRTLFAPKALRPIAVSGVASPSDGSFMAMVHSNFLYVTSTRKGEQSRITMLKHYSRLTSVAVSSDGMMLAAGDEAGAIFVYRNPAGLLPDAQKPVRLEQSAAPSSKLHWHSSSVRCLAFSHDGNVLVSGGAEAVLVTWQMTKNHFGTKSFLPRLRAPILAISVSSDDSMYCLTQADNSVRLIDQASGTITSVIRGIQVDLSNVQSLNHHSSVPSQSSHPERSFTGITPDPRCDGHVMIFGQSGIVQRYDLFSGKHISEIHTIPNNVVHGPQPVKRRVNRPNSPITTNVKLSASGKIMVTVDKQFLSVNEDDDFEIEKEVTTIRFWSLSTKDGEPNLTSLFRQPHGVGGGISSVSIHPMLPVVLTTSYDGQFKLWREVKGIKGEGVIWRSEAQLGYKGLPCSSSCFSNDGSILAVGCGSVLTLWHIEDLVRAPAAEMPSFSSDADTKPDLEAPSTLTVELLHALVHPPSEEMIKSVSFVQKEFPLFVAATENGIYVWNALTQGILWSSRIRTYPNSIATHDRQASFAIAVKVPSITALEDTSANENQCHSTEAYADQNPLLTPRKRNSNPKGSRNVKGSAGRTETRHSTDVLSRERPKRKFDSIEQSESKSTAKSTAKSAMTSSMDTAIVVFDASSPYPLRVSRLASGESVIALKFMEDSKRHSKRRHAKPAPLVCVNSKLDVSFYSILDNEEELSLLTLPLSPEKRIGSVSVEPVGKIESLLGKHHEEDILGTERVKSSALTHHGHGLDPVQTTSSLNRETTGQGEKQFSLMQAPEDHFDGPVHVQAAVSTKSFTFIQSLLQETNRPSDTTAKSNTTTDNIQRLHGHFIDFGVGRTTSERKSQSAEDRHKARLEFFSDLRKCSSENEQQDKTANSDINQACKNSSRKESSKKKRKESSKKKRKERKHTPRARNLKEMER